MILEFLKKNASSIWRNSTVSTDNPLPVTTGGGVAPTTSAYTSLNTSFAASGDNTVVAAVADQSVRVFAVALTFASPVDVTVKDGAGTTLGVFQQVTNLTLDPIAGNPRWSTSAGNAFIINLSAAVSCKGTIWHKQSA